MHSYIAIQNTYDVFEIALFANNQCIGKKRENKYNASKLFIPLLDELLTQNNAKISDFDFCVVNCGPGPFSTLRSIIASVNGLHFATQIPLIGIDGLDATFLEFYDDNYQHTIVLINAFNNEVYYLIADGKQIISKGYQKIDTFLEHTKKTYPAPINFIGNGVSLHQSLITEKLGNNAVIKDPNPAMCSVEMIGKIGLEKWPLIQGATSYIMPLHLKKHAVEL
jgi:tRNA threonylcarbamoyladenosine biosynthesis protein TsaB